MPEGKKIDMLVWDAEGRAAAAANRRALTNAVPSAKAAPEAKPEANLRGAMASRTTTIKGQRVRQDTLSDLPD